MIGIACTKYQIPITKYRLPSSPLPAIAECCSVSRMANPQDELDLRGLRAQVAALTARVHQLEQRAGIEPPGYQAPSVPAPSAATPPPPPAPGPSAQQPLAPAPPGDRVPVAPAHVAPPPPPDRENLEGKIGKVWLNRIGIMAILAGVAYFIKYAFDSGWIRETGRVVI